MLKERKLYIIRDDIKIYSGFVKKKDTVLSENALFFVQSLKNLIAKLNQRIIC